MRSIMEQTQTKRIVPVNRIILGLTGGIAAYKAAELTRLLVKQNIEVQVVMTEAACHFITATDRKSTRLNSSHLEQSRMPSSA